MLPTRLEVKNFLAYRSPDPVLFDGIHLACLTGPNGAGKSSLLDAITWALWGKARLRSDDDLIYQGQNEMLVQLDFLQAESKYRIVRKRQRGKTAKTGRSTLDLFIWVGDDETWIPIGKPSLRETEAFITELLRLDYDTFVNSAFLQQGRADAFTIKRPSERKEILGDILGLDQWRVYEDHAKSLLKTIEHNLGVIDVQLQDIARREAEEPALLRDLAVAEAEYDDASHQRAEAEARYAEVSGAEEQMNAAKARLARAEHRLKDHERDLKETEAEIARLQEQIDRLNEVVVERDTIEEGYAQLKTAREVDQELGEKLQQMTAIKDRLNAVMRSIESARSDLENQATAHRTRIEQASKSAAELDDLLADLADVQAEVDRLAKEEARRDELREAINDLNQERATREGENRALYVEMKELETRITQLEQAGAICPLCGQALDGEHKEAVIHDVRAEGTTRGDTWRANKERLEVIAGTIKEHTATIQTIESDLKRLQNLRARAAKLETRVDEARSATDIVQQEQSALMVIEQMLAEGNYAQELQTQRESIEQDIDALGYDHDTHNTVRETLNTLADYDSRQRDLETAMARLPELETGRQNAAARRERWLGVLEDERAEVIAAQGEIDGLQERVEEARRREEELRQRRTEERQANEQMVRVQQALHALEQARERKADLESRQTDLNAERSIYQDLRDAFGKNGVPAMIIEAAIPELEESANRLLAAMTGGRMHVRMDTQREKRTGGVAETLDILISDELGTRSYESYSGGEAFRVNFAIRVALSQMLARRAGAQLRTLFIDEGFGTQDEDGRQRLVEAINAVQDQFDLLLVITHIDELRDAFPVQIRINKTPDGSRIEMR